MRASTSFRWQGLLLMALLLNACGGTGRDPAGQIEGEPPVAPAHARPAAPPSADDAAGNAPPLIKPNDGELLLATPPAGWEETGAMQTPVLRMAEYGPGEPAADRLERLTFEAQTGDPLPDPIGFVVAVSQDLASRCEDFEDTNVSSGYENGYPTSVRLMICPKLEDADFGQVVMAKAIQGNEQFYVITRRLRVPPMEGEAQPLTAQDMAEWSTHLSAVQVCDTRDADHPCPESVTETTGEP